MELDLEQLILKNLENLEESLKYELESITELLATIQIIHYFYYLQCKIK